MKNAVIFNGREFAKEKTEELVRVVGDLGNAGKKPKMVAILIGDNPESELYLRLKEKKAKEIGINFEFARFSPDKPLKIINFIKQKNDDPAVNGIIVELPLPERLQTTGYGLQIINAIDVKKDVDCLTSENLKLLEEGKPKFIPPTVRAVGEILRVGMACLAEDSESRWGSGKWEKKKIVVVGSKGVVGKGVLSYLRYLGNLNNLIGIDKETKDISLVTKEADILISTTGVGHLIKKEMVKPGVIVIDVGIEKQSDGSLIGDVDFNEVKEVASFITPVPGGVGPVTVVSLMENLLQSVYH